MSAKPALIPPVVKVTEVQQSPAEAFRLFTEEMGIWWPMQTHSVAEGDAKQCGMQCHAGGEIYEITNDGQRHVWGKVTRWEPPHHLAFTWHPGREPDSAQEVALLFEPTPSGTRLTLEHRGWEKFGDKAQEMADAYNNGWEGVLERCYRPHCESKAG